MPSIVNIRYGEIGFIDYATNKFAQIAVVATAVRNEQITDIAVNSDGTIFAISTSRLYKVDRNGATSLIGTLNPSNFNALEFSSNGTLWGISGNSLYQINPLNAQTNFISNLYDQSRFISGTDLDLAFDAANNRFFATDGNNRLYSIQLSASLNAVTSVNRIGSGIGYIVEGLAIEDGVLYGYTSRQEIIINTSTGVGSFSKDIYSKDNNNNIYIRGADSYSGWKINSAGDFNGDGNVDILVHNASTNQNAAWLMDSNSANIGWQNLAGNPAGWEIKGAGDFNRDNNVDILWHNSSTNQNGVWLMNSQGANIGWQGMAGNPAGWEIEGTGDFNRDGNTDILWHNASTNQNGAWLINSQGVNIGWQGMAGNPAGWEIEGTGDFNRDGNVDILWHNSSTNQNGAWLMNSGGANIGWQSMAGNPPGWEIIGTGDFNRDSHTDILWYNASNDQNGAWLMNSGGANIGWQRMGLG